MPAFKLSKSQLFYNFYIQRKHSRSSASLMQYNFKDNLVSGGQESNLRHSLKATALFTTTSQIQATAVSRFSQPKTIGASRPVHCVPSIQATMVSKSNVASTSQMNSFAIPSTQPKSVATSALQMQRSSIGMSMGSNKLSSNGSKFMVGSVPINTPSFSGMSSAVRENVTPTGLNQTVMSANATGYMTSRKALGAGSVTDRTFGFRAPNLTNTPHFLNGAAQTASRSNVKMSATMKNGMEIIGEVKDFDQGEMQPATQSQALLRNLDQRERDACGVGFIANLNKEPTHEILKAGIQALECNDHRGGCNYDGLTGDGSGVMTQIPWDILQKWAKKQDLGKIDPEHTVVGVFFLGADSVKEALNSINVFVNDSPLEFVGWREVPVNMDVLGKLARDNAPAIYQLVLRGDNLSEQQLELESYRLRRKVSRHLDKFYGKLKHYSVCMSPKTTIYKGMLISEGLANFYKDLRDPDFKTQFTLYHRRYSTNTLPRWSLAQPFRMIGHNGEINTFRGNINWARSRDVQYESEVLDEYIKDIIPVCNRDVSDSAALDNMVELYIKNGYSPTKALMLLLPEAYNNHPSVEIRPEVYDFYDYYAGRQEAWDGPANVTFCDGNMIGACLDRNGLRPARYEITHDGMIYFGSEVGSNQVSEDRIKKRGRLGPGQMFVVDLKNGEIKTNWEIKEEIAKEKPFGDWVKENRVPIKSEGQNNQYLSDPIEQSDYVLGQQVAFGISTEDVNVIINPMAESSKEPVFSMGEDTPLPFLTDKPRVIYDYFKQRFAQVTNPPIDSLREGVVMSLDTFLGAKGNLLTEVPEHAKQIKMSSPVLTETNLKEIKESDIPHKEISLLYDEDTTIQKAIEKIANQAVNKVKQGNQIIILSDRGMNKDKNYIPPLLATGAIHHKLIKEGIRLNASIIVETGQCWSTHHYATLIGYGASAICPYLTFETIRHEFKNRTVKPGQEEISLEQAQKNYKKAVDDGILKILSKMGISLISSYQGAQIFEIIGISQKVVDVSFIGTASQVGGMTMDDLEKEMKTFKQNAFQPELQKLRQAGFFREQGKGEYHFNSKTMVQNLHKALYDNDYDHYKLYEEELSKRPPTALRDLLKFDSKRAPIPIDQVESIPEICKRFYTGGMSMGALSPESHETIAIAMNRIGGMSNSGEGGEDKKRYLTINDVTADGKSLSFPHLNGLKNGDSASSGIKQIASGRFGVTAEYLQNAKQIEIKVAQGAKPGEGGQLPGPKVSEYIAQLRYSKPGVTLISPPPHHDIYSIEDLVQLIYDLHEVNPQAKVSVKLVAEVGIGTIASGVAKANADVIQISGHEGGTGASPISSLKHCGGCWELGLAESHMALQENHLRERVALRVDGGIRAGWEIVMAAILGADEFGFGSIAMIAEGCIMARVCHLNSCPVGVATQKEALRARFKGTPENVVDFFLYLAQEVREIMSTLGYSKIDDLIGQTHLLKKKEIEYFKASDVDLSMLLNQNELFQDQSWQERREEGAHSNGAVLDDDIVDCEKFEEVLKNPTIYERDIVVGNSNRAVGTRIAGKIAREHGDRGFAEKGGMIILNYTGSAGQSFGAYCIDGLLMKLDGQANDYVGKSMNGGNIIIKPSADFIEDSNRNVIIGNTCVYGGTGGNLFAAGRAGERLAVRNSGCRVVVEGTGDHCCEYMTGGRVVVLGGVGRNLGAGMTGGMAYIMDDREDIDKMINKDVRIQRVITDAAKTELKDLIQDFKLATGSKLAETVLNDFDSHVAKFWQVIPPAEDNSPLTHIDIMDAVTIDVTPKSSSSKGLESSRRVPVTMSAASENTSGQKIEIKNMEQTKSEKLDSKYWDKKM